MIALKTENSQEWQTPRWLFDALNHCHHYTVDAASAHDNALCAKHWTKAENGLTQDWSHERVWLNPPFDAIKDWLRKANYEVVRLWRCPHVTAIVPVRSDTQWWHEFVMPHEVWFVRGRVQFTIPGQRAYSCPFPTAVVCMTRSDQTRKPAIGVHPRLCR